ncbi:MAG: tripartite tricarboxylate transporter TctB family protein [Parvularculales bacterium]
MRIAFLVAILIGAICYSYIAFSDLGFLTRTERPGPGFFPRIIGTTAVVVTVWALVGELLKNADALTDREKWNDLILLVALAVGYAFLLRIFGGFIATVIFLGVTLMILNRKEPVKNLLIAILIPSGVYLLFDRVLNASMPPAIFTLPI